MALTTINVGNIPNDGTGDDLREAFIKVNQNFAEVDTRLVTTNVTATNLGTVGEGTYAAQVDGQLQFKRLLAGSNTSLTSTNEAIIINSSGGLSGILVTADNGSLTVSQSSSIMNIVGGVGISTTASPTSGTIFINLNDTGIVEQDSSPKLSSSLNANDKNIQNVNSINANSFYGPLTGLVYGVDIRTIDQYFNDYWDFGTIIDRNNYDSIIEFIIKDFDVDFGTISGGGVKDFIVDLGPIVP